MSIWQLFKNYIYNIKNIMSAHADISRLLALHDTRGRRIDGIVVHHSASDRDTTTPDMIKQWHIARGFINTGYHYIGMPDGSIVAGRPARFIGAHCRGNNSHTIGYCFVGNFEHEYPTDIQFARGKLFLQGLCRFHRLPYAAITPHCEHRATDCPGQNLIERWWG